MTLLSGIIALALLVLFLGYYAVLIPFPPLVAIIATILLLAIADFVRSFREERRNHRPGADRDAPSDPDGP